MDTFHKIVSKVNNSLRCKFLDKERKYRRVEIILNRYFEEPDHIMRVLDYYVM